MPRSRCAATSTISPISRCASASSSTFRRSTLRTSLFGCDLAMPVGLGPVGMSGMYARRGEAQAARAAAAKGIPICLSSVSVCDLREVAAAGANPLWFQLYVIKDRAYMAELLAVAKEVKCSALVFTVDLPVPGARYRDVHSGLTGTNTRWQRLRQIVSHPRWAWDVGRQGQAAQPRQFRAGAREDQRPRRLYRLDRPQFRSEHRLEGHRLDPLALGRAAADQGHSRPRGCARGGEARRRRDRRLQPWRAPARRRPLHRARLARHRRRGRRRSHRSLPTAASAPASTCCACSRWARRASCSAAPGPMRWPRAAKPAWRRCSTSSRPSLRVAMQLTGVTSIDKVDRAILAA